MAKQSTNYTIPIEVIVTPQQRRVVKRRMECARQIYNTCLGLFQKRLRSLRADPQWRALVREAQAIKKVPASKRTPAQQQRYLEVHQALFDLDEKYKLTCYAGHHDALGVNRHFGCPLGCNEVQKAATYAWRNFEHLLYGIAHKLHFKAYGEFLPVENTVNTYGLHLDMESKTVIWGKGRDRIEMPVKIPARDSYLWEALETRTKYIRFFQQIIRGKVRYFIQAVQEGQPPLNDRTYGPDDSGIGIDLSPSTLVLNSSDSLMLEAFAPGCENDEAEIRRLDRKKSRSLLQNNRDQLAESGRGYKKGAKLRKSKRYQKCCLRRQEAFRKKRLHRKQAHAMMANRIVALGTNIFVEEGSIQAWTVRPKKITYNKSNGRIRCKKRLGKTIQNHAPAALLTMIKERLGYVGKELHYVDTFKVKASQFNHITGEYKKKSLGERWVFIDGRYVQRDLYSAFLLAHVKPNLCEIDVEACKRDWAKFLELHDALLKTCDRKLGIFGSHQNPPQVA